MVDISRNDAASMMEFDTGSPKGDNKRDEKYDSRDYDDVSMMLQADDGLVDLDESFMSESTFAGTNPANKL